MKNKDMEETRNRPYMPTRVLPGMTMRFGASNREFKVKLDRSHLIARLQAKQKALEAEMARFAGKTDDDLEDELLAELERQAKPSSTVFVGNLNFETGEATLRELFEDMGEIENIRIPMDRETGTKKGIAFIKFSTPEEAAKAVRDVNGDEVDGRTVKVAIAEDDDKPGGKGKGGQPSWLVKSGKGSKGGKGNRDDWECPSCGARVFSNKSACFKCGADKPENPKLWEDRPRAPDRGGRGRSRSRSRSRGRDRDRDRGRDRRRSPDRRDRRRGERSRSRGRDRRGRSPSDSRDDFGRDRDEKRRRSPS